MKITMKGAMPIFHRHWMGKAMVPVATQPKAEACKIMRELVQSSARRSWWVCSKCGHRKTWEGDDAPPARHISGQQLVRARFSWFPVDVVSGLVPSCDLTMVRKILEC